MKLLLMPYQKRGLSKDWAVLAVLLLALGCGNDPSSSELRLRIARVSGNNQIGVSNSYLPSPLVVLVTDADGHPVDSQRVDFEVVEGAGMLSVESALSDGTGYASTRLQLGEEPGQVRVRAQVFGAQEAVFFTATTVAGNDTAATESGDTTDPEGPLPGRVLKTSGQGHVEVADAPSLYLSQQFTIELWFRVDRLIAGNVFGWNQLLANNEYEIAVVAGTGLVSTCCYDGRSLTSLLDGFTPVEPGRWYHLALINDGTTQRILLNGELDSIAGTVKQHPDREMDLWFGNDPDAERPFDGCIDEVRIWNRPLSIKEIRQYMNQGRAGTEEGLVGYWTFEALDAQDRVPDRSGHGNDGTLVGDAVLLAVR